MFGNITNPAINFFASAALHPEDFEPATSTDSAISSIFLTTAALCLGTILVAKSNIGDRIWSGVESFMNRSANKEKYQLDELELQALYEQQMQGSLQQHELFEFEPHAPPQLHELFEFEPQAPPQLHEPFDFHEPLELQDFQEQPFQPRRSTREIFIPERLSYGPGFQQIFVQI